MVLRSVPDRIRDSVLFCVIMVNLVCLAGCTSWRSGAERDVVKNGISAAFSNLHCLNRPVS